MYSSKLFLIILILNILFICHSSSENIYDIIPNNADYEGYKIFNLKDVHLKLICNASHPYQFVSWSLNGAPLQRTDRINWDNVSVLTVNHFNTEKDVGLYECHVKNSTSTLPSLKFDIIVSPTANIPKMVEVEEGGKLSLICNVTGYPIPLVMWKIGEEVLAESYGRYILKEYNNVPSSLLEIENVTKNDLGEYICMVTHPVIHGDPIEVTALVQLKNTPTPNNYTLPITILLGIICVSSILVTIARFRKKIVHILRKEVIITPTWCVLGQPSKILNLLVAAANYVKVVGGADDFRGQDFHLNITMLLICHLVSMQQCNPGLQYAIWLKKPGYGKFNDIVLKYKKTGEKWIQICVQCKHGEKKFSDDEKLLIKTINADDLLSGKNKHFALVEYVKKFSEVKDTIVDHCETSYVLLTNRPYDPVEDKNYSFLQRKESNGNFKTLLPGDGFSVQYTSDLHNHLQNQRKLYKSCFGELRSETTEEFCSSFLFICDDRNLEDELQQRLSQHCKDNIVSMQNLQARLYYLVSQMYQHKRDPTQKDFIDVFNGKCIHYQIQPPHPRFTGRTTEINKIQDAMNREKGSHILDLLVTGMAGMGKTQIVLKYIQDNKQNFKHVIWINAENCVTLDKSFVDLAIESKLINAESKTDISHVMSAIYSYFSCDTLFVFDNASNDLLSKANTGEYIYLPDCRVAQNSKFIVISQDQKWSTNQPDVKVNRYSGEEALLYLDARIECEREEKLKLASSVQFWPLALCLAVSYIRLETDKTLGAKCVSKVIQLFEIDDENVHKPLPQEYEMKPYNASLRKIWDLLQTKLQTKGWTAIFVAADKSIFYTVKFLHQCGANLNVKDKAGITLLMLSARTEDHDFITYVLTQVENVDDKDFRGRTALHHAAKCGHSLNVKSLLAAGADIENKDNEGGTAIQVAAQWSRDDTVELLLQRGARTDVKDNNGHTLLMYSARNEDHNVFTHVLSAGCNVNDRDDKCWTALHYAASWGQSLNVKSLLDGGAYIESRDNQGKTPLHRAVKSGILQCVQYLLQRGADRTAEDNQREHLLDLCNSKDVKLWLLKNMNKMNIVVEGELTNTRCK